MKARTSNARRGSTLVVVSVLMTAVAMLSLTVLALMNAGAKRQRSVQDRLAAQYVAEAAIGEALWAMQDGGTGDLGEEGAPSAFGEADYWVEATDLGGGLVSLAATGLDRGAGWRIEVVLRETSQSVFTWGAFGDVGMTMDSNATVDSYDSNLGLYEDQDVNGSGSNKYALENGNVGSNEDVGISGNSTVHGAAKPGPSGTTTTVGTAVVTGSTTPSAATLDLPALEIPVIASSGDLSVSSSYTIVAGSHAFDDLTVENTETLVVEGPATIVVENMTLQSNSELIVDATNGPVEFFVLGDFIMNSNTLFASTTLTPADISINLNSDNVIDPDITVDLDEVDFDSNAKLYGTVYAPNASIEINSNFELFGSLVAYQVHLDSNSKVHFDEALLTADSDEETKFETVMWKGVPYVH